MFTNTVSHYTCQKSVALGVLLKTQQIDRNYAKMCQASVEREYVGRYVFFLAQKMNRHAGLQFQVLSKNVSKRRGSMVLDNMVSAGLTVFCFNAIHLHGNNYDFHFILVAVGCLYLM
jgi:hypothetical protein